MSTELLVFSPQQWRVLQALAEYRFLTVDQILRLGISKNPKSLRDKTLFALRHHKCIASEKVGSFLPDVHHLTKHGREVLSEVEGIEIEAVPSGKKQPFSALFARHRFAQVDFQIGLNQWVEERGDAEILLELQDFVRRSVTGKKRAMAVTELAVAGQAKTIIPDGTFVVGLTSGKTAIYLMEIHRSTQSKAVTQQLSRYFEAIKTGAVAQAHGYGANPIICSVHQSTTVMASVQRRLLADPVFASFRNNFVFRALDTLPANFAGDWQFADGRPASPFPLPNPQSDEG